MDYIFRNAPGYKSWGSITCFRRNLIDDNVHILNDTKKKYRKFGALQTLKRKLPSLVVE